MEKLIVKLPFKRRTLRTPKKIVEQQEQVAPSTARARKYRKKLKSDPSLIDKLKQIKLKKVNENKMYRQKVKDLRKVNPEYDIEIKAKEALRKQQQRLRKKKAEKKKQSEAQKPIKRTPRYVRKAANTRKQAERARKALPKEPEKWADFSELVLQIDEDDVQLRFLQASRPKGKYTWPDKEDVSWQPQEDVLKKLKPPQLVAGRGLKLQFDLTEIEQCQ